MQLTYRGVPYEPVKPGIKCPEIESLGIDRGAPIDDRGCKVAPTQPTFILLTYRGIRYLQRI